MAQYEQQFEQPSAILRYAKWCGVERILSPSIGSESLLGNSQTRFFERTSRQISAISPFLPIPMIPSISGISSITSLLYLCARQPVTRSAPTSPCFLSSATERIVSIASFFASSIKPQVLTITRSAPSTSGEIAKPFCFKSASIASASTWFLGQPRDIKAIFSFIKIVSFIFGDQRKRVLNFAIAVSCTNKSVDCFLNALFGV